MESLPFLWISLGVSTVALAFAAYLTRHTLSQPLDTTASIQIEKQRHVGISAFLRHQFVYVALIAVSVSVIGAFNPDLGFGWRTAVAFVGGSLVSTFAGFLGLYTSTRFSASTAISGGAMMGMGIVGISLIGVVILYKVFGVDLDAVSGYLMGCSLVALLVRTSGEIFTRAAHMSTGLIGYAESDFSEDNLHNPIAAAASIGNSVGKLAVLGTDRLESYVGSIIASVAILGAVVANQEIPEYLFGYPFITASIGILGSVLGVMYVKRLARTNPQSALMMGTYISAIATVAGLAVYTWQYGVPFTMGENDYGAWGPFWAALLGIVSGIVVGFCSEYFTSSKYFSVQRIAKVSQQGTAITVTEGTATGMQSTAIPVLVLALTIVIAYATCGVYGVAIASLGMLATTGMVVAVDSYGPIADNAGGMAEMSHMDKRVREITDNLDSVGNTTAAIGKGFAIGSAAFAAIGLLTAFMVSTNLSVEDISLLEPSVQTGILIGGMLPFLFSSFLFRAVGNCANTMIEEVRRQFRDIPGLKEGKPGVKPDSAKCVDIATKGAIQGMIAPGLIAVAFPIVTGFILGSAGLAGMLLGALVTGVMLGISTANSGGAMDNAKKFIEAGNFGGKNSIAHKAAVVGDTVGDPLKDTVGPSINILIKLMCVISLVLAPLFSDGLL